MESQQFDVIMPAIEQGFRGFNGEHCTIKLTDSDPHDHFEVWIDDKQLCYFHISATAINIFPRSHTTLVGSIETSGATILFKKKA